MHKHSFIPNSSLQEARMNPPTVRRVHPWLPALALALSTCVPASAATFAITGFCGPTPVNAAAPVSQSGQCNGPYGVASTFAYSGYGAVGAEASAFHLAENSVATAGSVTTTFSDQVVFSSSDPTLRSVSAAMNVIYDGSIAGGFGDATAFVDRWSGSSGLTVSFGGLWRLRHDFGSREDLQGTFVSGLELVAGSISPSAVLASLRTPLIGGFPLDTPIDFSLSLAVSAGATGPGSPSARVSAANTFEIPFDTDVFVLPPGVTANAGDWLVNNRRVLAVPEPETYALMVLGLAMVARVAGWRRRADGASGFEYKHTAQG